MFASDLDANLASGFIATRKEPVSHIVFTDHAIDRFIQRHTHEEEGVKREEIRSYLEEHKHLAVRLKQKTFSGQFLWKIGDYRVVTKRDNHTDVAVTILPEETVHPKHYSDDELERIQEYLDRVAAQEEKAKQEREEAQRLQQEALDVHRAAKKISERKPSPAAQDLKVKAHAAHKEAEARAMHVKWSVGSLLELMKLERANLKDWEKTVRHGMRSVAEEEKTHKLIRFVRSLDLPEARALLAELGITPETPEGSDQSRTEPYGSQQRESVPA